MSDDLRTRRADGSARTSDINQRDRRNKTAALIRRDGDECHWCGGAFVEASDGHPLQRSLDHVVPRRLGGSNAISNLVLAHRDCNERRANPKLGRRRTSEDTMVGVAAPVPPGEDTPQ